MQPRIMVLDSDAKFANALHVYFEGLGFVVDVFSDGEEGVVSAINAPPSLIVLAVELPRVNGFLVCKKIKKESALRDVPLVICSNDPNAEEIFNQHKKLKTRADVYIKKPVAPDQLFSQVRSLVPGAPPIEEAPQVEPGISLEPQPFTHETVDADMASATDSAFETLMIDDDDAAADASELVHEVDDEEPLTESSFQIMETLPPEMANIAKMEAGYRSPLGAGRPSVALPPMEEDEFEASQTGAPMGTDPQAVRAAEAELADLRKHVDQLESRARDVERLERELRDLRTSQKPSRPPSAGISSREFLDLREALNGKDKELLELRDQLSGRDKQLLDYRDKNLQLERKQADFEDNIADLEAQVSDWQEKHAVIQADKESAQKRAEDYKTRFDRAEARAKKLEEDIDALKVHTEKERVDLAANHTRAIESLKQEHTDVLISRDQAHRHERDNLEAKHHEAVSKLNAEHEAATLALQRAHAEESAKKKSDYESQITRLTLQAEQDKADALEELGAQLKGEREAALQEAEEKRLKDLEAAHEKHEQALAESAEKARLASDERARGLEEKHAQEMAVIGRKLAEAEQDYHETSQKLDEAQLQGRELKNKLDTTTQERDRLSSELTVAESNIEELEQAKQEHLARIEAMISAQRSLEQELDKLNTKIREDDALLERVRKAMSIGLGLLEEQKNGSSRAE